MELHDKARCSSEPFKPSPTFFPSFFRPAKLSAVSFSSSRNQNDENYAANIRPRCNYQAWEYAF